MDVAITAIGIGIPRYRQKQKAAADMVALALQMNRLETRLLKTIYRSSGIEYRHSVLSDFCKSPGEYEFFPNDYNLPFPSTAQRMQVYKDHALPLTLTAVENCLAKLNDFNRNEITHLITVSCTGMYAPGIDIELVQALNLASHIKRTVINFMGCYGAFNAIKIAEAVCKADPDAKVLIVSVELCTIHFQKNDSMDSIFSNSIFADGAAAILIESNPQRPKYLNLEGFYCDLLPAHSKDMTWQIADSGFDIVLSSYVPQAIQFGIEAFVQRLLQQQTLSFDDIKLYAIHPGGDKILKACEKALTITAHDNRYSYQILREYGNMSSATVLFVLNAIWDDINEQQTNNKIFSCAFGPGLTLESMILRISCT